MWGDGSPDGSVFSAYAEVVPYRISYHKGYTRILRVRGGSSRELFRVPEERLYSPRTRR